MSIVFFQLGKAPSFAFFSEAPVFPTLFLICFSFFCWPVIQKEQLVMLSYVTSEGKRHNSPFSNGDSKSGIATFTYAPSLLWKPMSEYSP